MKRLRSSLSVPALLLASLGLLSACDDDGAAGNPGGTVKPPPVNPDDPPAVGESSFVSADGREGDRAGRNAAGADGGVGVPEATTVKLALPPMHDDVDTGCPVIEAGVFTVSVAAVLVTEPQPLVTTQSYEPVLPVETLGMV